MYFLQGFCALYFEKRVAALSVRNLGFSFSFGNKENLSSYLYEVM